MICVLIRMEVLVFSRLPTVLLAFAALAFLQVPAFAAGATITLQIHPHAGAESLDISGTAPAGSAIDLFLYGTVSTDLPIVRLNHLKAQAGPSGTFSITVPVAPNFIRGSVVTVEATTPDGAEAIARTTFQGPGTEYVPAMDSTPNTPF